MKRITKDSHTNASRIVQPKSTPVRTNASVGLSPELETTLNEASAQLRTVAAKLAQHLEGQISTPEYTAGAEVAADRLIDWTADIFALSEDMKFYLNPPKEKE